VKKAYDAMVYGEGPHYQDPYAVVDDSYDNGIYDEFVLPSVLVDENDQPIGQVADGGSIIFYNFRPDRAIQISRTFAADDSHGFGRGGHAPIDLDCVMLTGFAGSIDGYVAYAPVALDNTIGEDLAPHNLRHL